MKTYTILCSHDEPVNTISAFKTTYPAGHYMGADGPFPTISFRTSPFDLDERCPCSLDSQVTNEPVIIRYPDWLVGGGGQPRFIHATVDRVLRICDISHPAEVVISE